MRRAILLGLLGLAALGVAAGQRVTVQELEGILAGSGKAGSGAGAVVEADLLDQIEREDALAPRLAAMQLTERLTNRERMRLESQYKLGPLTKAALELLGDRSAPLDPPASEMLAMPAPDEAAQRAMLAQASAFVFDRLQHLPDFFALLTTTNFSDGPLIAGGALLSSSPGMHRVGASQREITFSNGREVFDSARGPLNGAKEQKRDTELESQGEFGTEAATVMLDLRQGTIEFHHWVRGDTGPVAVFRYSVPSKRSHYEVKYACHGSLTFHAQPAYHGEISVDAATGVLLRFTVQAESREGDPITQVASVIEYGEVTMGSRRYICPVRSLAFTVEESDSCDAHKRPLPRPIAMLNRILFSDYHRLGSEMTILPGEQPAKPGSASRRDGPNP
ncbi:hypothetical protein DYQ86_00795 [Acidobacteria bacterium AB60]|nr:hypothetical protein DYQ86_00795 [Acidobacteria bacterium AB60]